MRKEEKKQMEELAVYEAAFALFASKKIEHITMEEIADHTDYGVATLYRHYNTKLELAAGMLAYQWNRYFEKAMRGRTPDFLEKVDAIDRLSYTYDLYIDLYQNHKDLLKVNDDFNHFYHDNKNAENLPKYEDAFGRMTARFHTLYERAKVDGTIRTDIPEDELQRVLLHTMMGACNHYLGGFSFGGNEEQEYTKELIRLKDILMNFAKGNL